MNRIKENLEKKYGFLIESAYFKRYYDFDKFIHFNFAVPNTRERSVIKVPDGEAGVTKDMEILLNEEVEGEYKNEYEPVKDINTPIWFQELFNRTKEIYFNEVKLTRVTNDK